MGSFSTAVFRSGKPSSRHTSGVMLVSACVHTSAVFSCVRMCSCVRVWVGGGGGEPAREFVCFSLAVSGWTCLLPTFILRIFALHGSSFGGRFYFLPIYASCVLFFSLFVFADLFSGKKDGFFIIARRTPSRAGGADRKISGKGLTCANVSPSYCCFCCCFFVFLWRTVAVELYTLLTYMSMYFRSCFFIVDVLFMLCWSCFLVCVLAISLAIALPWAQFYFPRSLLRVRVNQVYMEGFENLKKQPPLPKKNCFVIFC